MESSQQINQEINTNNEAIIKLINKAKLVEEIDWLEAAALVAKADKLVDKNKRLTLMLPKEEQNE